MIKTKSGRKYISPTKTGKQLRWRVSVWNEEIQKSHYVGSYYTLSEAVNARNEYCATSGYGTLSPTD